MSVGGGGFWKGQKGPYRAKSHIFAHKNILFGIFAPGAVPRISALCLFSYIIVIAILGVDENQRAQTKYDTENSLIIFVVESIPRFGRLKKIDGSNPPLIKPGLWVLPSSDAQLL